MIQALTFSDENPKFTIIIWAIFFWKTNDEGSWRDPEISVHKFYLGLRD